MLGGCYPEENSYDDAKAIEVEKLQNQIADLEKSLKDFSEIYDYDGSNTFKDLKRSIAKLALQDGSTYDSVLNYFEYDDTYRNRCGDRTGDATGLLTWLDENEFKKHIIEYARKNKGNYCPHSFLRTMSNYGFLLESHGDPLPEIQGVSTNNLLHSFGEKDIYSKEESDEIERIKKEELRKQKEAEEAARMAATEAKERAEFERLKTKFQKEN